MHRFSILTCLLALAVCTLNACGGGSGTSQLAQTPEAGPTVPGLEQLDAPEGVDQSLWQEIKDTFATELAKADAARATAGVPTNPDSKVTDFRVSLDENNDATFEWTYRNIGDYDQNSEVNLADLTRIAMHFMKGTASADWSTAQVADGDGNGEINLADISPIAINFLNNIASYRLGTSATGDDGTWASVESVDFSVGIEPPLGGLLEFSHTLPNAQLENGNYFRITPDDGTIPAPGGGSPEGIPSDPVLVSYTTVPQNLNATQGSEVGTVRLNWDVMPGAQFFQAYRADSIDGSYSQVGQTNPGENTYSDVTVLEGVHYWYKVSAELDDGPSDLSDPAEGWSNTTPDAPTNVQASDGTSGSGIVVTWDKPAGANGYKIFRDTEDFQVATLADVDSWEDTTLIDTDTHTFWVSAVSYTLESALSDPDTGFLGTMPAIASVTPVKLYHGTEVTLSAVVTGDLPITYGWDFGGGATPNITGGENPTVTIAASGTYSGNLICTNAAGQDVFPFSIGEPLETDLLIVYNSDMPEDLDLVEYYSSIETGRAIHPDYRLGLPLGESAAQTISRDLYGSDIRDPIIAFIDDPLNSEIKANIKYLLMMKGVPYRIPGTNGGDHNLSTNACVDSELCMLRSGDSYRLEGPVWSGANYQDFNGSGWWQAGDVDFEPDTYPLMDLDGNSWTLNYLVGRITAYTYEDCKLMIDRSLAADTSGDGWIILDTKPGSNIYETMHYPVWPTSEPTEGWVSGFDLLDIAGMNVFGELTADVVTREYAPLPAGAADNILAYCSWGKHSAFDQFYILDDLDFVYTPGACFMSYESINGVTMRNTNPADPSEGHPGQGQIADFIYMGGTCAIGNVYEPWTDGVGDERWVFDRYVHHGDRWIEAAYKGLYYLSWQEVVIGDPLCRVVAE